MSHYERSNTVAHLPVGTKRYTALNRQVLAVLSRRQEGWCIYLGAVAGVRHPDEWEQVAQEGTKVDEALARVILSTRFALDPVGLPYVR